MKPLFADTAFYVALLNQRDAHFHIASAYAADANQMTVTTEFVLLELGSFFSRTQYRQSAFNLFSMLLQSDTTQIIPASSKLFHEGLALYGSRKDKDWSLTDCCSFVVMKDHDLKEALTSDKHFEQAGFKTLLRN